MSGVALILDDDRDTADMLQVALGMAGYKADVAFDHLNAIKCLERQMHCALFMDYHVPRMDPCDFVAAVRRICDSLPIILISGRHDVDAKAREMGASGYIQKPFAIEAVVDAVQKHCCP